MFISREEFERRKSIDHNVAERLKIVSPAPVRSDSPVVALDTTKFKNDGTQREMPLLTDDLRAVVATAAIVAGPEVAAEIGDVSPQYAEVLARAEYPRNLADPEERERRNQELRQQIYEGLGKIREAAQVRLMMVLGLINDETLQNIPEKDKARLAAQMANQLSGVIDRTINKGENIHDGRSTHLHLYAPERRPLAAFEIKRVNQVPEDNSGHATASGE